MVKPAMIRRKAMDLNADLAQLESLLKSKRRNGTYKENTDGVLLHSVETCRKAIDDLRDRLTRYEASK